MWETIKEKLKSAPVWLAVLAQVLLVIALFAPNISEPVKIVGASVVEILTLFGVLNNPNNRTGF